MSENNELLLDRPLVAVDLETTGLNLREDRIVEISCVKVAPNGDREIKTRRLNPERPISAEASAVHGIRDEDVAHEPTFARVGRSLFDFLDGCDLTGFNLTSFDLPILAREMRAIGLDYPPPGTRIIDSRRIFVAKEPRTLEAAVAFYCGRNLEDAHTAEADAVAAADVLVAQVARYDDLPRDPQGLDAFCHPQRKQWRDQSGKLLWKDGEVVIGFGKHKGESLRVLAGSDRGYLEWVAKSDFPADVVEVIRNALAGDFDERQEESPPPA